jgi:hypothetical protein
VDRIRRRLKTFVWVALLAFVGLAVAPTISRAIRNGDEPLSHDGHSHEQMAAMASASAHHHHGHDHSDGGAPPAPTPGQHEHSIDHCVMCVVAGWAFALAATPPEVDVRDAAETEVLGSTTAPPRWRDDWSPATSRGPPSIAWTSR